MATEDSFCIIKNDEKEELYMIAIYLAPLYLLVCAYILFRSIHWIQVLHAVFQNVWVCRGIGLVYLLLCSVF